MLIEVPRFFSIFATVLNPNSPNQLGEETKMLLTEVCDIVRSIISNITLLVHSKRENKSFGTLPNYSCAACP